MPWRWSNAPGPTPDSCKSCGEADAARGEHDLGAGAHVLFALLPADEHATTAQRARGIALEQEPRDSRLRPGLEVGSRRTARVQEGARRIPAPATALVHFEVTDAFVVAAVEVGAAGQPCLHGGLCERLQDLPAQALAFDAPLAATAVVRRHIVRRAIAFG